MVAAALVAACAGIPASRPDLRGVRAVRPPVAFEILRDSPDMFILDLRTAAEFDREGHLKGAVNIPLEELDARMVELRALRDATLLVYCRDDACGMRGVHLLQEHGFAYLFLLAGGYPAWVQGGFSRRDPSQPRPELHPDQGGGRLPSPGE